MSTHIQRGNLQDAINEHNAKGTRFSEGEIVYLFRGTCEAVRAMHAYRAPASTSANAPALKPNKMTPSRTDLPDEHASSSQPLISSHDNAHSDDEDEGMLQAVGDSEGGYSYHGGKTGKQKQKGKQVANSGLDGGDVIFDGDEEVAGGDTGDVVPYAHRDLKPGYAASFCPPRLASDLLIHNAIETSWLPTTGHRSSWTLAAP